MTIQSLLTGLSPVSITGNTAAEVSSLVLDSRKITSGAMFFALKGAAVDGHTYIETAIEKGAVAIVCSELPATKKEGVCYLQFEDVHEVVGLFAATFYGNPSAQMKVIGVTGTNGKTTVATVLFQLFEQLGESCGLISTVENKIGDQVIPATHTTPDAISLQALFAQMLGAGCTYVFMEVSSHAVHQHRIGGVQFDGGIFTNITHDHLDYHKTFDEYIRVKKRFLDRKSVV